jgi:hypothetical protein
MYVRVKRQRQTIFLHCEWPRAHLPASARTSAVVGRPAPARAWRTPRARVGTADGALGGLPHALSVGAHVRSRASGEPTDTILHLKKKIQAINNVEVRVSSPPVWRATAAARAPSDLMARCVPARPLRCAPAPSRRRMISD